MPRFKSRFLFWGLTIAISLASLAVVVAWGAGPAMAPAQPPASAGVQLAAWQLSNPRVLSSGSLANLAEGELTTGYRLQADAIAMSGLETRYATFELNLTLFRPNQDLPGQKAGWWYVTGAWSLTDLNASTYAKRFRHNPAVLEGQLSAELDYDPRAAAGGLEAVVRMPMAYTGGRWTSAEGALAFDKQAGGVLSFVAAQSPESAAIERQLANPGLDK